MVRVSNTILSIFNAVTFLIGIATLFVGLFFAGNSGCQKELQSPYIYVGATFAVISLLGLIGSCCRINFVLVIYLILLFLIILALIAYTGFAFLVTNEAAGKVFSKTKIMDFHNWLRKEFVDGEQWKGIHECLIAQEVCIDPGADVDHRKSPLQAVCCQPPPSCGFVSKNATFWEPSKTSPAQKAGDCAIWSNQQDALCFECETCKSAVVDDIRKKWDDLAILNLCFTLYTIIFYSVGCCARRNNKEDKYKRYRGYP